MGLGRDKVGRLDPGRTRGGFEDADGPFVGLGGHKGTIRVWYDRMLVCFLHAGSDECTGRSGRHLRNERQGRAAGSGRTAVYAWHAAVILMG